jgi:hypothetical protein
MGLLNKGVTIIHFDETYYTQSKLQNYSHDSIDFQQLEHVNLYCEKDSISTLRSYLEKRRQKGITFIGSGNYHYVSFLLLKEIKEPFTLVLFDNHPDLGLDQGWNEKLLSCGSWVSYALTETPNLQQVVIIGPTGLSQHINHPRVVIYPFDGSQHYSLKAILSAIQTQYVYISIDKDVLNRNEAITNWDQGKMDLNTLLSYLDVVFQYKQVEGVDICGEEHLTPMLSLLPDFQIINRKNEKANLMLLEECLKWTGSQTKGA